MTKLIAMCNVKEYSLLFILSLHLNIVLTIYFKKILICYLFCKHFAISIVSIGPYTH